MAMRSAYQKVGGANVPVLLHTRSDGSVFVIGGEIISPDQVKTMTSPDEAEDKAQAQSAANGSALISGAGSTPPAMTVPGSDQNATIAALVQRVNELSERMGQPPLDLATASDTGLSSVVGSIGSPTDTSTAQAGSASPVTAQPSSPAQGAPTSTIPPQF